MKNESCISSLMFCRKCKKIKLNVYDTHKSSSYKFLCDHCAKEEGVIDTCKSCGREGVAKELNQHGGYCHKCETDNITECEQCGVEIYKSDSSICEKCISGENKVCINCGGYFNKDKISSDNLCPKCSIKIHKRLSSSEVNEIVECIECGREVLVNDLNDKGLCVYCHCEGLESEIKKLKYKQKKRAYY